MDVVEVLVPERFVFIDGLGLRIWIREPLGRVLTDRVAGLRGMPGLDEVMGLLREYDGCFCAVIETEDECYLMVDRVRSLPLFFARSSFGVFVSCSFDVLCEVVSAGDSSEQSRLELLTTGFVLGGRTLREGVVQVEAGHIVRLRKENVVDVVSRRYARLEYQAPPTWDSGFEALDSVLTDCFTGLAERANGRQLVIPLSGGYDSRLCAIKLREIGYDNVRAFSYGFRGNAEAELSRMVAADLGISWSFSEYTASYIRTSWNSACRQQYRDFAGNGSSLPHYQDFFAVQQLKDLDEIDGDAIFVPGHSADFNAGSHLPEFIFESGRVERAVLLRHLALKHFDLWPAGEFALDSLESWLGSTLPSSLSGQDAAAALDGFNMAERQAKFIVNSCRVYEFFGYDWWLPYWDRRFVDYWCRVPLRIREGRLWYVEYVKRKCREHGVGSTRNAADNPMRNLAKRALSRVGLVGIVRRRSAGAIWRGHPLNPFVVFGRGFASVCAKHGAEINGCFTLDYLREIGCVLGMPPIDSNGV